MTPCVTYCTDGEDIDHFEFYSGDDYGYGGFSFSDLTDILKYGLTDQKYHRLYNRTYAMPWVLLTNEGVDLL